MGKTMALRVRAVRALDPCARDRLWELTGTGDLAALEHVAYRTAPARMTARSPAAWPACATCTPSWTRRAKVLRAAA